MIGAPVTNRHARETATCNVYTVVARASVLRNGFLIAPRGILHEDCKNAIFLELTIRGSSLDIRVSTYSEIRIRDI